MNALPFNYSGLHLYEEAVLGFPLPLRERDRVRGKAGATHLLIQTKSAVDRIRLRLPAVAAGPGCPPEPVLSEVEGRAGRKRASAHCQSRERGNPVFV